jgi:signal transduction histidine kinase
MISIAFYSFGYAFEISSTNLADILFWLKIEYIGIPFFSLFFLVFTLQLTENYDRFPKAILLSLFIFSTLTFIFQHTNWSNLFYKDFELTRAGGLVVASFSKGLWYWLHQCIFNAIILYCSYLYLKMMMFSIYVGQVRAAIMLFSTLLPWPFYIVYISGLSPYNIDLSPLSLSLVGMFGVLGLFKYNLLNFIPLVISNVFNSLDDAVFIFDEKNSLRNLNTSAKNILKSVSGFSFAYDEKHLDKHPFLDTLRNNRNIDKQDLELYINGEVRAYYVSISSIRKKNACIGLIVKLTDITERKRNIQLLIDKEKELTALNAAKDKYLAIIAHDLRAPFNSLINLSDFMQHAIQRQDYSRLSEIALAVNQTSKSSYHLLRNLLEWSKMQEGLYQFNPQMVNLQDIVTDEIDICRNIANAKSIVIEVNEIIDIQLCVDVYMIKTIVRNIIINAIKFSYPGKKVSISSRLENGYVSISIVDQGIGMTTDVQNRLFELRNEPSKLGTNKERGAGLGLIICNDLIKLHKGHISIESEPGVGSCFTISIPV